MKIRSKKAEDILNAGSITDVGGYVWIDKESVINALNISEHDARDRAIMVFCDTFCMNSDKCIDRNCDAMQDFIKYYDSE